MVSTPRDITQNLDLIVGQIKAGKFKDALDLLESTIPRQFSSIKASIPESSFKIEPDLSQIFRECFASLKYASELLTGIIAKGMASEKELGNIQYCINQIKKSLGSIRSELLLLNYYESKRIAKWK